MIIQQRRIRSISRHLAFLDEGTNIVIGIGNLERYPDILSKLGFDHPPRPGDAILPRPAFGPVSIFNAEGKNLIHKDQPKETVSRLVEWTWNEWRGRDDTVERSDFVDRPYQRYPRTFISPPSVEVFLTIGADGNILIVSPEMMFHPDNFDGIIHTINLFLEIFRECEVFSGDLTAIKRPELRRLNWEILPPGRYPWERLQKYVEKVIEGAPEGNRSVINNRFETLNSYGPDFHAIGKAGFWGYVVFGFQEKTLFVFESAYTGNATYVFGENWEELSKLTKAQILDEKLQTARIIHLKGWHDAIKDLLNPLNAKIFCYQKDCC